MTQPSENTLLRRELASVCKRMDKREDEFNETVSAMLAEIQRQAAEIARLRMEKSELQAALAAAQKSVRFHVR